MSFTIKDLEALSGIKAHTIRIWEQRYALLKPNRTDTNIRYYDGEELKNLLNIALLNKYGFKISHITNMTPQQVREKIVTLSGNEAQLERIVTELIQYMVDFDTDNFESLLNKYIAQKGIERSITQVIFPFLERVGILWQTSGVNPAQEHLVTNIIRQKFILGIENVVPFNKIDKTILLFTPEGEYHELGLLYVHYLLKSKGVSTIYLGCNVPAADLPSVLAVKKIDYLYTHITSLNSGNGMNKFINNYKKNQSHNVPLVISGAQIKGYIPSLPTNTLVKLSIAEMHSFISEL